MSTSRSPSGARNDAEPQAHTHLHLTSAALPFFHPTRAQGTLGQRDDADPSRGGDTPVLWRSRASRKRLYTSKPVSVSHDRHVTPKANTLGEEPRSEGQNEVVRWLTELRVHHKGHQEQRTFGVHFRVVADVSFWVAVMFVIGSTAWVSALCNQSHSSSFSSVRTIDHQRILIVHATRQLCEGSQQ
jgi:hypothetical protein